LKYGVAERVKRFGGWLKIYNLRKTIVVSVLIYQVNHPCALV